MLHTTRGIMHRAGRGRAVSRGEQHPRPWDFQVSLSASELFFALSPTPKCYLHGIGCLCPRRSRCARLPPKLCCRGRFPARSVVPILTQGRPPSWCYSTSSRQPVHFCLTQTPSKPHHPVTHPSPHYFISPADVILLTLRSRHLPSIISASLFTRTKYCCTFRLDSQYLQIQPLC